MRLDQAPHCLHALARDLARVQPEARVHIRVRLRQLQHARRVVRRHAHAHHAHARGAGLGEHAVPVVRELVGRHVRVHVHQPLACGLEHGVHD